MALSVAVIGAGPSGLAALRHLSMYPQQFRPVALEKSPQVGGLWNYSDDTDTDIYGLPSLSCINKSMRTNVPKDMMHMPDMRFPEDVSSFMHHSDVKAYLDTYAKNFDLRKFIEFQTFVTNVTPLKTDGHDAWSVSTRDLKTDDVTTDIYDVVIVCNGIEGVPNIPLFPGMETFKGPVVHTKTIRDHEVYKGKTVLVVGASFSALEIMFDLGPLAHKMYVAHRGAIIFKIPDYVKEVPNVKEIMSNGVILENGECVEVEVIILATGYRYSFPFLSDECRVTSRNDCIRHLHAHMFHIERPTLCIIGLIEGVPKFQTLYCQAHYICAVLRGQVKLPTKEEMYKLEEQEYHDRVVVPESRPKLFHNLFGEPYNKYIEMMARHTGTEIVKPGVLKINNRIAHLIQYDYANLKQMEFKLIGDDDFLETM